MVMIADHLLAFGLARLSFGGWAEALRLTATRVSLPVFMLTSGLLLGAHGRARYARIAQVALLGLVVSIAVDSVFIGMGPPDILTVYAAVMLLWPVLVRCPVAVAALGVVQMATWPLYGHAGWYGYEPGEIAALLAVGVLAARATSPDWISRWGGPAWLAAIGRAPLAWYGGHIAVLVVWGSLL